MDRVKEIACNVAAILFAAITVWNLQRDVPIDGEEYANYMYSMFGILLSSCAISFVLLTLKNDTRIIKSSFWFSSAILFITAIKCFKKIADHHSPWDNVAIGVCAILCYWKILISYSLKVITLIKTLITELHMRWQTRPRKKAR